MATTDPPLRSVIGLLDHITATSLDEDYAQASERAAAGGRRPERRPGTGSLAILALFGILVVTAAVQTARTADQSANSHDDLVAQINERKAALAHQRDQIGSLHRAIDDMRASYAEASAQGRAVQNKLTRLGLAAGASPARGPGIKVTVDDAAHATAKQQVLDKDLQKLVNGLWEAGAEAVAINEQRITNLTAIRGAGESITVNYASLKRPYVVSAIGNPDRLGARFLDTAGGQTWVALHLSFGLRFDITPEESMKLPAAPHLALHYAVPRRPAQANTKETLR